MEGGDPWTLVKVEDVVPSLKMLQVYLKETAAREGEREGPKCPKVGAPRPALLLCHYD